MKESKKQEVPYLYNNKWNKDDHEERFLRWQEYRKWTTGVIDRTLQINECIKGGTVAILGAGNCDDIDLRQLSNQFSNIYLFDIDEEALNRGINKYVINSNCTITTVTDIEFTGLQSVDFFDKIKRLVANNASTNTIKKEIIETLKSAQTYKHNQKYMDMFDYVILMPVYTQMGSVILGHEMMKYCKKDKDFFKKYEELKSEYEMLDQFATEKCNDFIMMLAKKDAPILIFSDFAEFRRENMQHVLPIIEHIKSGNSLEIMKLCQNNLVSGANEGFLNMFSRVKDANNIYMYHWVWPFSDQKIYIVRGIGFNKKHCL